MSIIKFIFVNHGFAGLRLFLLLPAMLIFSLNVLGQCNGSWSNVNNTYDYLCANGPYTEVDLGSGVCPTIPQFTYTFSTSTQSVQIFFSAFGTSGYEDESRMAIFLNGSKIDLSLACQINISCQNPMGNYSINDGCLSDQVSGLDGGLAGSVVLTAAAFGLPSISSVGFATSEPGGSGTIFQIGACDSTCNGIRIDHAATFIDPPYLFPNPSANNATLFFPDVNSFYRITVINEIGEIINIIDMKKVNNYTFSKEEYGEGLFFILVEDENQNFFKNKIIFY